GIRRRAIGLTSPARCMADNVAGRGRGPCTRLHGGHAGQERLQYHQPHGKPRPDQRDRAAAICGESGWHEHLSRGTLPHHIFGNHPRRQSPPTMANRETAVIEITPEVLLKAYACGIFPMAESADDPALFWLEPEMRGIIPLDRFHV